MSRNAWQALVLVATALTSSVLSAQQVPARGSAEAAPPTPRAIAPVDLTGVWVSVVSEDWRWRMMRPAKGDYASVPLTPQGRAVADTWDPARDEAAGEQCRSYAAPAIMRVPGRVRIAWQDDYTLRLETDAGMQTRLLQFQRPGAAALTAPATAPRSWQGGYLRKNGAPFSEDALVTEYFDAWKGSTGDWFTVMTVVRDPRYLRQPFVTTTDFEKEPDDAKWDPSPCQAR